MNGRLHFFQNQDHTSDTQPFYALTDSNIYLLRIIQYHEHIQVVGHIFMMCLYIGFQGDVLLHSTIAIKFYILCIYIPKILIFQIMFKKITKQNCRSLLMKKESRRTFYFIDHFTSLYINKKSIKSYIQLINKSCMK